MDNQYIQLFENWKQDKSLFNFIRFVEQLPNTLDSSFIVENLDEILNYLDSINEEDFNEEYSKLLKTNYSSQAFNKEVDKIKLIITDYLSQPEDKVILSASIISNLIKTLEYLDFNDFIDFQENEDLIKSLSEIVLKREDEDLIIELIDFLTEKEKRGFLDLDTFESFLDFAIKTGNDELGSKITYLIEDEIDPSDDLFIKYLVFQEDLFYDLIKETDQCKKAYRLLKDTPYEHLLLWVLINKKLENNFIDLPFLKIKNEIFDNYQNLIENNEKTYGDLNKYFIENLNTFSINNKLNKEISSYILRSIVEDSNSDYFDWLKVTNQSIYVSKDNLLYLKDRIDQGDYIADKTANILLKKSSYRKFKKLTKEELIKRLAQRSKRGKFIPMVNNNNNSRRHKFEWGCLETLIAGTLILIFLVLGFKYFRDITIGVTIGGLMLSYIIKDLKGESKKFILTLILGLILCSLLVFGFIYYTKITIYIILGLFVLWIIIKGAMTEDTRW